MGATGRIAKLYGSCANAAITDGYGAVEIDLTLSGTSADHTAALSSWINITTGTATAGHFICAQSNGVYEVTAATVTNAKIIFGMRMTKFMEDTDGLCFPFSLNTNNTAITALIDCQNISDLGSASGKSTTSLYAPYCRDAAGNIRYVLLYS
jgi:hypothetical protein